MVRKSSRTGAKALEKSRTDSPTTRRKSRRRKKSVSSDDDSDSNVTLNKLKDNTTEGSDSDSEKGSNHKRTRTERSKQRERNRRSSTSIGDEDYELGKGKSVKGKSKDKNKSNNDQTQNIVEHETEKENVQVTEQSPPNDETVTQNVFDKSVEEEDSTMYDTQLCDKVSESVYDNVYQQMETSFSETMVTNISIEEQVVTVSSTDETAPYEALNQNDEVIQKNIDFDFQQNGAPDTLHQGPICEDLEGCNNTQNEVECRGENLQPEDFSTHLQSSMDPEVIHSSVQESSGNPLENLKEHSSNENVEKEAIEEMKTDTTKKIVLKRTSGEQILSEGQKEENILNKEEEKDSSKGKNILKKKIILKRPQDTKESSGQKGSKESAATEGSEWNSSYEKDEIKEQNIKSMDTSDIKDPKPSKRISLKRRATVDEKKLPSTEMHRNQDQEIIERRSSLQEPREKRHSQSSGCEGPSDESKRRHSITFEDKSSPKKPSKRVKLLRNLSLNLKEGSENQDASQESLPGKKHKWGKTDASDSKLELLDFETIKTVCPNLDFLKEDEVDLELSVREKRRLEIEKRKQSVESRHEDHDSMEMEDTEDTLEDEVKENIIAMNRKISIVDDTASKMKPPPSPAKNLVTNVIYVTNLVRPFTVKQLRELLERTGKIKEDGFWTDKIKSKCFVKYETSEEAEATRNALHGVNWPIGNGKKLIIEYSTEEEMEKVMNPPAPIRKEKTPEKENKIPEKMEVRDKIEERKAERTSTRDLKQWDMEKSTSHRKHSRAVSESRDRQRRHSRRSSTPDESHHKRRKREEPAPQKAMDDLFLKTKATPSIYWQPLSPEEIALKQQQRQVRMEEHKRRMEEIRSTRGPPRDHQRERDRNFRRR